MVSETIKFVANNPNCFERSLGKGHVTGSSWLVNHERNHVLLIHHFKLDKWFQPGGHCDGDPDVLGVARREAMEETGLTVLPVSRSIFDVDIHQIPENNLVPAHLHYDIRFMFETKMTDEILATNREVKDIKWIPLQDIHIYSKSESILRMVKKTKTIINIV